MPRISSAGARTARAPRHRCLVRRSASVGYERAGRPRSAGPLEPAARSCRSAVPASTPQSGVGGQVLSGAGLHAGEGGVELRLDVGREHARRVVEGRDADAVVRGVEEDVTALGRCRPRSPGSPVDDRHCDGASRRWSGCRPAEAGYGQALVDVDADAVDAGGAGGVEDAVAGLAGDLEQDVDALFWLEERSARTSCRRPGR